MIIGAVELFIYFTKNFANWQKGESLASEALAHAVEEIENGLVDATLGAGLVKKRVAAKGSGKSGSCRTLIAIRKKDKAFFIFGFAKNEKDNITQQELKALKKLSKVLLGLSQSDIQKAIDAGELIQIQ